MPKITDPAVLVKRATRAMTTLRGCVVTPALVDALADLLFSEFPGLPRQEAVDLLSIQRIHGQLLTDAVIDERARQFAIVITDYARLEVA